MSTSRRDFLRSLGIGAVAGAALPGSRGNISLACTLEPVLTKSSDGFIRLNSNENAYGPSSKVADAIRSALGMANRYPFMKYEEVMERIASFHKVNPKEVIFGCGSTELLRVAACAFLGNGRKLIQATPTFEAIEQSAKALGSEVISVPLTRSAAHDLHGMLSRAGTSSGLVYICNPNNPTGSLTPRKDMEDFIGKLPPATRVVVDEAYHDFVIPVGMYSSFIDSPLNDERVIVTRTLSKVYGLAGLRLGYAIASPKTVEKMRPFLTANSVNSIMTEIVGVALNDTAGVKEAVRRNRDDRQEFLNRANTRNLKPIDPHANFVMINTLHPAKEVIEHFRKHNILIGPEFPLMDTSVRVSLGTPEEMSAFWHTWDLIPWSNRMMHH
jgi:histidinol-phosphate aminotransferase